MSERSDKASTIIQLAHWWEVCRSSGLRGTLAEGYIRADPLQRCVQVGEKKLVKESMPPDLILGVATQGRATTALILLSRCTFHWINYSLDPSTSIALASVAFSVLPVRHSLNRSTSCWVRASLLLLYKMCDNSSRKKKQLMPYLGWI